MKLPDALLQATIQTPYIPIEGDIDIASLSLRQDASQDNTSFERPADLFNQDCSLTPTGARVLLLLQAFQDEVRRAILSFLATEEQSVQIIANHRKASQPAISHHLGMLFTLGLLAKRPEGKLTYYRISEECRSAIAGLINYFQELSQQEENIASNNHSLIPEEDFGICLKMLSDPMRLKILHILRKGEEINVGDLCKMLKQSQPAVSHHLALMLDAHLIDCRKDGKHHLYSLDDAGKKLLIRAGTGLESLIAPKTE